MSVVVAQRCERYRLQNGQIEELSGETESSISGTGHDWLERAITSSLSRTASPLSFRPFQVDIWYQLFQSLITSPLSALCCVSYL